jgi:hypothetical protein
MMTTAADRYRQIAEECRVFADDAKSRNWSRFIEFSMSVPR